VLVGRTGSDVLNNVITFAVMALTGLVVGWRVRTSVLDALAAVALLLLFAYAFSWIFACVGLLVPSPEVVNNASFIVIFPITFVANTFVPSENLPPVLQTFAEWNPVSSAAQAARELFGNTSPAVPAPDVWSLQNPVLYTLLWCLATLLVFVPLATRLYKRAARR
jgi:ABC-type polysaccharide/polyol phosphate export permease